ncbi:ribonuclease H-like domain-containing protein [Tanacetum coccineum]
MVSSTSTIPGPVTTEEKEKKKNDVTTASLSDGTVYDFLANQPNGSQFECRKFLAENGKERIIINDVILLGYDFVQRSTNQESSKRTVNVEDIYSIAMVAFDGAGFDWSFMVDEEVPTNLALMAFSGLRDASFRDSEINALNIQIEKLKKEKESNQIKIDKFDMLYKSLGLFPPPILICLALVLKDFQQPDLKAMEMVQNYELNNVQKGTGQREVRLVWNNALRTNHQNFSNSRRNFTPTAVLTKSGIVPISNARQAVLSCSRRPLFCGIKVIKREFSNARTPQQNRVAERKNRTLIEAARTMLADSLLPIPFWAEAVNTACYVQNRVLVTKPHNKTPYELLIGRTPIISFMRPFGCPVTILNTLDHLGKFDGKADEGFLVGYSINSKAFRVFNSRTRKVEENLHVNFLENKPNVVGSFETSSDARQARKENVPDQEYILLPLLHTSSNVPSNSEKDESSPKDDAVKMNEVRDSTKEGNMNGLGETINTDSTNRLNTVSSPLNIVSSPVNTVSSSFTTVDPGRAKEQRSEYESLFDPLIPDLEDTADLQDTGIFGSAYDDEYVGAEADLSNLETNMSVSPIPITRIHKDYPKAQIIGEVDSAVQTRRMHKQNEEGLISFINKQKRTNHKDLQTN